MKKSSWIKIHIFSGLFTCWYIVAFGVSSLILNHHLKVEKKEVAESWTTQITYEPADSGLENATRIRDSLNLMGWIPTWQVRNDSSNLDFVITHIGKTSDLRLNLVSGILQVKDRPKGMLAVLHGLHFFNGNIPNAPLLLRTWKVYQWFTLLVLLVSLCTGIWLWLRYGYKKWEFYIFGGLFLISLLLMTVI